MKTARLWIRLIDAKRLVLSTYLFRLMGFSGICITLERLSYLVGGWLHRKGGCKSFWKIERANAICWMYLDSTAKNFFFFRNKTFFVFQDRKLKLSESV